MHVWAHNCNARDVEGGDKKDRNRARGEGRPSDGFVFDGIFRRGDDAWAHSLAVLVLTP